MSADGASRVGQTRACQTRGQGDQCRGATAGVSGRRRTALALVVLSALALVRLARRGVGSIEHGEAERPHRADRQALHGERGGQLCGVVGAGGLRGSRTSSLSGIGEPDALRHRPPSRSSVQQPDRLRGDQLPGAGGQSRLVLGAGGGPGPCGDGAAGFTDVQATGVRGQTHKLSGRVTDRAGNGVGGVSIAAEPTGSGAGASTTTAADGRYSVSLLAGSYRVTPSDSTDTFAPGATTVEIEPEQPDRRLHPGQRGTPHLNQLQVPRACRHRAPGWST